MEKSGFTPLDKSKELKKSCLAGFTLLEIMVAAILLVLVTTGLAYVFLAGRRHILHSRSKIQATELGRHFLAPLQMDVRQDQWSSNCLGNEAGCPATPANNVTIDNIEFKPGTIVTRNLSGTTLSKVKLTITWDEPTP